MFSVTCQWCWAEGYEPVELDNKTQFVYWLAGHKAAHNAHGLEHLTFTVEVEK